MELCAQGLNNLFPISMSGQTSSRGAADAMFAIELHIERVEGMSTRADGDSDGVCVLGDVTRRSIGGSLVLGFV